MPRSGSRVRIPSPAPIWPRPSPMRELTLARGIATVACGAVWLIRLSADFTTPMPKISVIKLAGRSSSHREQLKSRRSTIKMRTVARSKVQDIRSWTTVLRCRLTETFAPAVNRRDSHTCNLWPTSEGCPPRYADILSVGRRGTVQHIQESGIVQPPTTPSLLTQRGDVIDFILGYEDGLKKSAVLSAEGLTVSTTTEARPAIPKRDCQWLYKQALSECAKELMLRNRALDVCRARIF